MVIRIAHQTYEVEAKIGDRLKIYHLPGHEDNIYIFCKPDGTLDQVNIGCEANLLADVLVTDAGVSGWMHGIEMVG